MGAGAGTPTPRQPQSIKETAMPQDQDGQSRLPFPPQYVVKSNALCRARWTAESIIEPRLVALLASKISVDDEEFKEFEIHVSELIGKEYGGDNIRQVEQAVDKSMSRVVTIKNPNGTLSKCNIFYRCEIDPHRGLLTLTLHPDLKQHFLQLKQNFAKYNLLDFMLLPSVYSQRMFEYLTSWKDKPEKLISIDELHEYLSTPKSYRENFKSFRIFVLEKAHKDIHKHTSLRFSWQPIKSGRRVGSIRFIFGGRYAETKIEDAKKTTAKALANETKRAAALKQAKACAAEKGGVCVKQDRSKFVCGVCHEWEVREFYAQRTE